MLATLKMLDRTGLAFWHAGAIVTVASLLFLDRPDLFNPAIKLAGSLLVLSAVLRPMGITKLGVIYGKTPDTHPDILPSQTSAHSALDEHKQAALLIYTLKLRKALVKSVQSSLQSPESLLEEPLCN